MSQETSGSFSQWVGTSKGAKRKAFAIWEASTNRKIANSRAGELIGQALLKSEAELEALENLEVIEPSAAETEAEVRHLSRHPVVGLAVGIGFGGCGTFGVL